jgi:hypothetical protein
VLDLARRVVALEVGGVVPGVHRQNSTALNSDSSATPVRWLVMRLFQISRVSPSGTKVERLGVDARVAAADDRLADAVPTAVAGEVGAHLLPRRRPQISARSIAQVQVAPADVEGCVVVAVADQAPEPASRWKE